MSKARPSLPVWAAALVIGLGFTACSQSPTTFDAPFPKKPRNMADLVGPVLSMGNEGDTGSIIFRYDPETHVNYFVEVSEGDTIWKGLVSKHRGMIYLSEEELPGRWIVGPLWFHDDTLQGVLSGRTISDMMPHELDTTILKALIVEQDPDAGWSVLRMDKRVVHRYFRERVPKMEKVPLQYVPKEAEIAAIDAGATTLLGELSGPKPVPVVTIGPNPALTSTTVSIDVQEPFNYEVRDLSGRLQLQGSSTSYRAQLDVSTLSAGVYVLTLRGKDRDWATAERLVRQ